MDEQTKLRHLLQTALANQRAARTHLADSEKALVQAVSLSQQPGTGSHTPVSRSDVEGFMTLLTPPSLRLLTDLMPDFASHVEHCSECAQAWDAFALSFLMHVPAAAGITST